MKPPHLRTGKIPPDLLARLLSTLPPWHDDVIVGPRLGEDAAVVRLGQRLLVAATDPITFATEEIGWYAVQVNANDVGVMGARPRWFLAAVLLPEGEATPNLAEQIFAQIRQACAEVGAQLIGGHFEVTYHLPRPIVVGHMLGEPLTDPPVTSSGAQPGDLLILTKAIALEGTALLAREVPARLTNAGLSQGLLERARALLRTPGISVLPEALAAAQAGPPTAMHDPTEGGLATGLWELCQASSVGATIDLPSVPVLPETQAVCEALGLDYLGLLASGSLLVTAPQRKAEPILDAIREAGVEASPIGTITPAAQGLLLRTAEGTQRPLPTFEADEVTRAL